MIKKINVRDLRVGMYIHDLNCGWIDHPFAFNQFRIKNSTGLNKVLSTGVKELFIDTERGLDADAAIPNDASRQQDLKTIPDEPSEPAMQPAPLPAQVDYNDEIGPALEIARHANQLIGDLIKDAKLGKRLDLQRVEQLIEHMTHSLIRNPDALLSLGRIRQVDHYTFEHSVNVCTLMVAFAHHLQLEPEVVTQIGIGAMLHDIGKVKIPDAILKKPGPLSVGEFEIMRSHVQHGIRLAEEHPNIDPIALQVVAEHHERFDGSGYPRGRRGDQISLYGQLAAISDVYDAITTDRCYHTGIHPTQALARLYEWSRFHFNPQLTQQFIRFIGIYPPGSIVRLASGKLGIVLERRKEEGFRDLLVRALYCTTLETARIPEDIDLSRTDDHVVEFARPEQWGLSAADFLRHLA